MTAKELFTHLTEEEDFPPEDIKELESKYKSKCTVHEIVSGVEQESIIVFFRTIH